MNGVRSLYVGPQPNVFGWVHSLGSGKRIGFSVCRANVIVPNFCFCAEKSPDHLHGHLHLMGCRRPPGDSSIHLYEDWRLGLHRGSLLLVHHHHHHWFWRLCSRFVLCLFHNSPGEMIALTHAAHVGDVPLSPNICSLIPSSVLPIITSEWLMATYKSGLYRWGCGTDIGMD